jgi:hypothetical protein
MFHVRERCFICDRVFKVEESRRLESGRYALCPDCVEDVAARRGGPGPGRLDQPHAWPHAVPNVRIDLNPIT